MNNPTLTIELESPSDDILLLKSHHWKAQKSTSIGPYFELYPDGVVSSPGIDIPLSSMLISQLETIAKKNKPSLDQKDCFSLISFHGLIES